MDTKKRLTIELNREELDIVRQFHAKIVLTGGNLRKAVIRLIRQDLAAKG